MRGDAARQINASYRHNFEPKVACLASHDGNHGVEDRSASRAGRHRVKCRLDDRLGAITSQSDPLRCLLALRRLLPITEEVIHMGNADSRADVLITHVLE